MARTQHGKEMERLRAALEESQVATANQPTHRRIPVSVPSPERTWRPYEKTNDRAMNLVLEILIRDGEARQSDIASEVAARMCVPRGTASSYVSGALLAFREVDWASCVERGAMSPIWRIES